MAVGDIRCKFFVQVKNDLARFDFLLPPIVFKHGTDKLRRIKALLRHVVVTRVRRS